MRASTNSSSMDLRYGGQHSKMMKVLGINARASVMRGVSRLKKSQMISDGMLEDLEGDTDGIKSLLNE